MTKETMIKVVKGWIEQSEQDKERTEPNSNLWEYFDGKIAGYKSTLAMLNDKFEGE